MRTNIREYERKYSWNYETLKLFSREYSIFLYINQIFGDGI